MDPLKDFGLPKKFREKVYFLETLYPKFKFAKTLQLKKLIFKSYKLKLFITQFGDPLITFKRLKGKSFYKIWL